MVAVCAKIELEIAQLDAADAQVVVADLGFDQSGLDRVIPPATICRLHLVLTVGRG